MKKLFSHSKSTLFLGVLLLTVIGLSSCAKKNGFECPNRISISK